jgi:hypothetical protein
VLPGDESIKGLDVGGRELEVSGEFVHESGSDADECGDTAVDSGQYEYVKNHMTFSNVSGWEMGIARR